MFSMLRIKLILCQEAFFAQTGHQRDLPNTPPFAFLDHIYDPDTSMAMDKWHSSACGNPTTFEIRWKKIPNKAYGSEEDTKDYLWTLSACVPIKAEDGTVTGIFGCNTDISGQKEATRTALLRVEAERRLASFTETAPVGVYQCDKNFKIDYCNDQWFRITGHPRMPANEVEWKSTIYEDDLEGIGCHSEIVLRGEKPHTFSFRLKKLWTGPDGVSTPTWVLATATTHFDADGVIKSIVGTMTDVSQLKWAEAIQRGRVEEALESKRQQENFIDMTSHEMRMSTSHLICNPFLRLLICLQVIR
jgi:PAS domain S-box-containing protein